MPSLAPVGRLRFPRAFRMVRRTDFLAAQGAGRKIGGRAFLLFVRPRSEGGPERIGVTVSRKVGNAVVRNRVKRRIRESARHLRAEFPVGADVVVLARPLAAEADSGEVRRELESLLRRARRA